MTNKEIFAKNLKNYMEKYDENQTELAKVLGCTSAAVSLWCLGQKMPRFETIAAISRHYNCTYTDLLGDSSEAEGEASIVALYRALSAESRKSVIDYLSYILHKEKEADK